MKLALITGSAKALIGKVRTFSGQLARLNDSMHVLCVSVLSHAATTRDTRPLNAFYAALPINLQTSLRQYVGRTFKQHPEAECLTFSKDEFHISKPSIADSKFADVCATKLINPDGKQYKRFYERDVVKEAQLLNDVTFLSSLKKQLTKAKGEASEVSGALVVSLEDYINKAEKISSTLERQSPAAQRKAKARATKPVSLK